jgi:hypothetical protein
MGRKKFGTSVCVVFTEGTDSTRRAHDCELRGAKVRDFRDTGNFRGRRTDQRATMMKWTRFVAFFKVEARRLGSPDIAQGCI